MILTRENFLPRRTATRVPNSLSEVGYRLVDAQSASTTETPSTCKWGVLAHKPPASRPSEGLARLLCRSLAPIWRPSFRRDAEAARFARKCNAPRSSTDRFQRTTTKGFLTNASLLTERFFREWQPTERVSIAHSSVRKPAHGLPCRYPRGRDEGLVPPGNRGIRESETPPGQKIGFHCRYPCVRELGELLVGRDSTALLELIKNAYDADATRIVVNCFRPWKAPERGRIVIEDNAAEWMKARFVDGSSDRVSVTRRRVPPVRPFWPSVHRVEGHRAGLPLTS